MYKRKWIFFKPGLSKMDHLLRSCKLADISVESAGSGGPELGLDPGQGTKGS
jgi:hypothetical protein